MTQTKLKIIENNDMDKENRNKSLEAAVGLIEKNYGNMGYVIRKYLR